MWESQHRSSTMFMCVALKENAKNNQRYCGQIQRFVWIQDVSWRGRKMQWSEESEANMSSWSYDMEGHAKKCVQRYCELANKTTQQLYKVATPCIDDHQFKEEEKSAVGELSKVCAQIVLKCLYLARIGRPDIFWSVNKLARAVTKWMRACDKRLARLMSFEQCCHVGNTAQQCGLGIFSRFWFYRWLRRLEINIGRNLLHLGGHTFVPISWMCKKQTSVSQNSTEAEIISLDAGLRMDGIPALDLWNWFIEVFHCNQNQPGKTKDSSAQGNLWHRVMSSTRKKNRTKAPTRHDSSELFHIDGVPSNFKISQSIAMLYVFAGNKATIKMIINGRSPTMRHASRTHRVSLDWLFKRIHLDPKIHIIRYIDTKHHIADTLTKGHFTLHTWRKE